ncbi:hypothetical protein [Flavobacterium sp. UBA7682]|uniref:hypothetical protein n=1 Tax=Flavobacterium sp. UBA7682 TaxID=1946560 RepID=UPI0025BE3377|nr:hypothetical protein [Flavobacterium sp. UBA7682]
MINTNATMVSKNVKGLKQHPLLKKFGIGSLSQFEIDLYSKYGIPAELIIVNSNDEVISNWEYVEAAATKEIKVFVLDVSDDDLLLVLATKNIRKKLKPSGRIQLIISLKNYLTETDNGKELSISLGGASARDNIATILNCGPSTIQTDLTIYQYAFDMISELDEEKCKMYEAHEVAKANMEKLNKKEADAGVGSNSIPQQDAKSEEAEIPNNMPSVLKNAAPEPVEISIADKSDDTESEDIDGTPTHTLLPDETSKLFKTDLPNEFPLTAQLAGSKKFVPCQPIVGITVRYADGREYIKEFDESYVMESKKAPDDNAAEFHQIYNPSNQAFIQINLQNISNL